MISRKDWIFIISCLALIFTSLLIVFVKKYNDIKTICRIPRPRITPALARNTPEQSIEMNVIQSLGGTNINQVVQETIANPFQVHAFNNTKYNENLISYAGSSFLITYIIVMTGITIGSRYGFLSLVQTNLYLYLGCCCLPVIYPTIYFTRNPNHFIYVMRDLNIL